MSDTQPERQPEPRAARHPETPPANAPSGASPFEQRRARLKSLPAGPGRDCALAMCRLDEATDPTELRRHGREQEAAAVTELVRYLVFRAHQRAAWALHGHPFEPPRASDEQLRESTELVERLFRDAMQTAFPPLFKGPSLNLHLFERTLAAFVAGELSMHELAPATASVDPIALHGIPNGATFFCFAESVLLFLRLDLQPRFWTPTLRSFVCGARFFAANYWQGGRRTWARYTTTGRRSSTSSGAILTMLDQYYRALEPQQLADELGRTLAVALRDEPTLPHPLPSSPEFR